MVNRDPRKLNMSLSDRWATTYGRDVGVSALDPAIQRTRPARNEGNPLASLRIPQHPTARTRTQGGTAVKIKQPWKTIPCRGCGAAPGQNCYTKENYRMCRERQLDADKILRSKIVVSSLPFEGITVSRSKHTWSTACKRNGHTTCSGITRGKHGIKGRCGCPCHKVTSAIVTNVSLQSTNISE